MVLKLNQTTRDSNKGGHLPTSGLVPGSLTLCLQYELTLTYPQDTAPLFIEF